VDIYLVGCLKLLICTEKFEDTNVVIRSVNQRGTNSTITKKTRTKWKTTIYKILHRGL